MEWKESERRLEWKECQMKEGVKEGEGGRRVQVG